MKKEIERVKIDEIIKKDFQNLPTIEKKSVLGMRRNMFDGEMTDYSLGGINTSEIIKKSLNSNPVILDIGTGKGGVPTNLRKKFQINAFGIRGPSDTKSEDYIYEVDIHNLSKETCFESVKFDFIFSNMTFFHLADPIKALQEAYLKLKPNGIMLINNLVIPGISATDFAFILEWMKKEGYCITYICKPGINYEMDISSTLVIKKLPDKHQLSFPLKITGIDNEELPKVIYSSTIPLPSFPKTELNHTYNQLKPQLDELAEKIELGIRPDEIGKFLSETFKKLQPLSNFPCELSALDSLKENFFYDEVISKTSAQNSTYCLERFIYIYQRNYKKNSKAPREDLIKTLTIMGHLDILGHANKLKFSHESKAMGLPELEKDFDEDIGEKTNLILKVLIPIPSGKLQTQTQTEAKKISSGIESSDHDIVTSQAISRQPENEITLGNQKSSTSQETPKDLNPETLPIPYSVAQRKLDYFKRSLISNLSALDPYRKNSMANFFAIPAEGYSDKLKLINYLTQSNSEQPMQESELLPFFKAIFEEIKIYYDCLCINCQGYFLQSKSRYLDNLENFFKDIGGLKALKADQVEELFKIITKSPALDFVLTASSHGMANNT